MWLAATFTLCVFGGLVGRLCFIQGKGLSRYRELAWEQHFARVPRAGRRGDLLDRRGRTLATSVRVESVYADPRRIADPEVTARRLAWALGVDARELVRRFSRTRESVCVAAELDPVQIGRLEDLIARRGLSGALEVRRGALYARPERLGPPKALAADLAPILGRSRRDLEADLDGRMCFVWVKRKISPQEKKRLLAIRGLEGVGLVPEYKRVYPNGELAAQLIGFVGVDGEGLAGLELALDDFLRGTGGYVEVQRDAAGRPVAPPRPLGRPARAGSNIQLTLDVVIQSYAEEALREAWDLWAPQAAVALVIEPATGDVLAAASLPSFDPNCYQEYDSEALEAASRARYVVDWMEPGSVMKPFVLAGALDAGVVDERTRIFCENGVWLLGSRRFHDHHAYGELTAAEVIVKSSNIGAAKIGMKLGAERLYQYLRRFGFGQPTGFILPGENPGLLRPTSQWTSYSLPSICVGQEVCVNPLQLALGYCALANGGLLVRPRVVWRRQRHDGTWAERPARVVGRAVPEAIAARVRTVLCRVVEEGTGRRAKLDAWTVGGKTGTAQKPSPTGGFSHDDVVCSFVGMAPVERPRLLVVVSVDRPTRHVGGRHFGGTVAAPVVGRILERSLAYLGVTPDKPDALFRLGLVPSPGGRRP